MDSDMKHTFSLDEKNVVTDARAYQRFLQLTDSLDEQDYRFVFGNILADQSIPPYWYHDIIGAVRRYNTILSEREKRDDTIEQQLYILQK